MVECKKFIQYELKGEGIMYDVVKVVVEVAFFVVVGIAIFQAIKKKKDDK